MDSGMAAHVAATLLLLLLLWGVGAAAAAAAAAVPAEAGEAAAAAGVHVAAGAAAGSAAGERDAIVSGVRRAVACDLYRHAVYIFITFHPMKLRVLIRSPKETGGAHPLDELQQQPPVARHALVDGRQTVRDFNCILQRLE